MRYVQETPPFRVTVLLSGKNLNLRVPILGSCSVEMNGFNFNRFELIRLTFLDRTRFQLFSVKVRKASI